MPEKKNSMALVVEDEESIRALVADTLWDEGYSILSLYTHLTLPTILLV
jgi:CheY-like chemotaxis protein